MSFYFLFFGQLYLTKRFKIRKIGTCYLKLGMTNPLKVSVKIEIKIKEMVLYKKLCKCYILKQIPLGPRELSSVGMDNA